MKTYDEVGQMMAWEAGELDRQDTIELFQHLLDSGLVYTLQGCYGRMAQRLLNAGLIVVQKGNCE